MKNTTLIKVLLTILTIVLAIVIPIWIGPETEDSLPLEWTVGVLVLIGEIILIAIVSWIFREIYNIWSKIID